jgi:hypothetical protein
VKFPNLTWAIRERGSQFQFAAQLGESESWMSRRLTGRVEFTDEERERVALTLGFRADWLFQTPQPPAVNLASRSGSMAETATTSAAELQKVSELAVADVKGVTVAEGCATR